MLGEFHIAGWLTVTVTLECNRAVVNAMSNSCAFPKVKASAVKGLFWTAFMFSLLQMFLDRY